MLEQPMTSQDGIDISSVNKQGVSINTVMPMFDSPVDMGISPTTEGDFWIDPDMWNSDSDDPCDSVCSILLEDCQSCTFPLDMDVEQCNINLGNMDDLFDFTSTGTGFDNLWVPAA